MSENIGMYRYSNSAWKLMILFKLLGIIDADQLDEFYLTYYLEV
jgi:hypothetical protein